MTTTPQRFTKRPVTIDAIQYDEHRPALVIEWIRDNDGSAWLETRIATASRPAVIAIETLEGTMNAQPGDWIIRGVQGEFYPCKPDIFAQTYQSAAEHHGEPNADAPTDAEVRAAGEAIFATATGKIPPTCDLGTYWTDLARAALVAAWKVSE